MSVSKNTGTPKWMVKIMENPIKLDDLGVPLFLETPIYDKTPPSVHPLHLTFPPDSIRRFDVPRHASPVTRAMMNHRKPRPRWKPTAAQEKFFQGKKSQGIKTRISWVQ